MRASLIAAASLSAMASLPGEAAPSPGVCITADIGLIGVAAGSCLAAEETNGLLDKQVSDVKGKPDTAEMMSGNLKKTVQTCRDYIAAEGEGWSSPDERFHRVCEPVMMLSGSKPATQSFLRDGDADLTDLTRLTALALPGAGPIDPEAAPDARSAEDMRKAGAFEVKESKADIALAIRRGKLVTTYREIARGDVDNDGFEDLLVERDEDMGGGNNDVVYMLLTRIEANGMLVLNDSFGD